jgi:glycosyltransferase involved in cell wall biosynthesis
VRDAAATLSACLSSIARQSFADFECLVVDDGSVDASAEIAHTVAQRDPRFVIVRQPRRGLVAALQAGAQRSRGELVARMDGDDLMVRDRLAAQIAALDAEPSLALVGAHVRLFPRAALRPGRLAYEAWLASLHTADDVAREAFVECPLAHPTWMVRAAVLGAHGYREVPWAEDYDVLLRVLAAGHRVGVVPRRLLHWRDHGARLSRTHPRYALGQFVVAKAHFLCASGVLAGRDDYVLWGYGSTGRALARALLGLGRRPRAIVELHRGRLGNRIFGAPVIAPEALPAHRGVPVVVSVAGTLPRQQIRTALCALGYRELHDFVCTA